MSQLLRKSWMALRLVAQRLTPQRKWPWMAAGVLATVVLVIMSSAFLGGGTLLLDDIWVSDLLNNNVPPRAFLGEQLRLGNFPLWVPGVYGGLPLLPQGEAAAMSPLTWIVYGLLSWPLATTLSVALHTWLAGFGMTLLARRLGACREAALVCGVAFMFCGFLVGHVKHMNLHHAACWLPWMAHAVDRLRERPCLKRALVLGAVGGLQITEGHPQMLYITLYLIVPLLAYRLLEGRRRRRLRSARYLAQLLGALVGGLLVALALSAPYLLSATELFQQSERGVHDAWTFATRFEFRIENLLTLGWAYILGDASNTSYQPHHGIFWESWLYIGVLPLLGVLAALAIGARRVFSERPRLLVSTSMSLLLAGFGFSMMRGADSRLYTALFRLVPGLAWFRFHHRFSLLLIFAVILAGGFGLTAALAAVRRRFGPRRAALLANLLLALAAADMTWVMRRQFPVTSSEDVAKPPATVEMLRQHAPAEPWRIYAAFGPESHVEAFYEARGWSRDLQPDIDQWALLQPSLNLLWGIDAVNGYTSMIPQDVGAVLSSHNITGTLISTRSHGRARPVRCPDGAKPRYSGDCQLQLRCRSVFAPALGAFNVRYLLSPVQLGPCRGFELIESVPAGRFDIHVYLNEHVLPRAYWVDEAVDVSSTARAARRLLDWRWQPARQVLRTRPGQPESPLTRRRRDADVTEPGGRCSHHSPRPGESRVICEVARAGYLVISETRYPGQRVWLDGELVEPFTANAIVLGLEVGPGHHEVRIAFQPSYASLVPLSALGWLGLLGLAGAAHIRRQRRQDAMDRTRSTG